MNNIYTGMLHKPLALVAANVPPLLDDPWPPAGVPTVCKVKKKQHNIIFTVLQHVWVLFVTRKCLDMNMNSI